MRKTLTHGQGVTTEDSRTKDSRTIEMTFQPAAGYPLHRPRRLRGHARLRELLSETRLSVSDLIYPLFVYHGKNLRREISSMPGQYQLSLDRLGEMVAESLRAGHPRDPPLRHPRA